MEKIFVTGYENPDLDGTACAFAYAEFLQKTNKNAVYGIFGKPRKEAEFVIKNFKIDILNAEKSISEIDKIILVDASDLKGISEKIDPRKVIEIIDHRKIHETNNFPNAKIQIELVGAAATLIAEKFKKENIDISEKSAALLYSAILWNTINFKNNVTTERDIKIVEWLKTKFKIPEDYIHKMFSYGSHDINKIKEELFFAEFNINNKKIGIAQLESVNIDKIIKENLEKLKDHIKRAKEKFDFVFITCIDLEKGYNRFIAIDKETQELLSRTLDLDFENIIAKREGIIMRKEIIPKIKGVQGG